MVGAPPSAIAPAGLPAVPSLRALLQVCRNPGLSLISGVLVTLPVFLQAPWVRLAPFSAALFTVPLLGLALALSQHPNPRASRAGELLVGFCGSWLAGSLFWGWCRLHPVWHLPIEAFALPLAIYILRNYMLSLPVSLIEAIKRAYHGCPSAKELAIFVVPFCC